MSINVDLVELKASLQSEKNFVSLDLKSHQYDIISFFRDKILKVLPKVFLK